MTADRCNAFIIAKCVDTFKESFKSSLSTTVPFLNEQDFKSAQSAAENKAKVLFRNSRKMGADRVIAEARADLETQLVASTLEFKELNQSRLEAFKKTLEVQLKNILTEYNMELDSKVKDVILSPEEFKDVQNQAASNARQKFQDLKCDPSLEPFGTYMLDKHIENVEKWLQTNDMNRERAEHALQMSANNAAREYTRALDSYNFKELAEMEEAESGARSRALTALEGFHLKLSRDTVDKVQHELTTQLDVIRGKAVQHLKKEIESDKWEVQVVIENAIRRYKDSIETLVSSATT